MLPEERLSEIKNLVDRRKSCSINEIANMFDVSMATARRDLKMLTERNMIRLTRGGAISLTAGTMYDDPPDAVKKGAVHEEIKRISGYAAELVKDGETLVLDSGSAMVELARALRNRKLTIATNDLLVAYELVNARDIDLTFIGGAIRKDFYKSHGYFAQEMLRQIYSDKVFLGLDAIDLAKGCMVTNAEELIIKKLMLASAKEKIVVCDHTKFSNVAFFKLCDLQQIDRIITGLELDDNTFKSIADEGVGVIRV